MRIFEWLQGAYSRLFYGDWKTASVFFLLAGGVYFAVFLIIRGIVRKIKNKNRRGLPQRKLEFTLPDRENTYVRSRLGTVLNCEADSSEEREEELPIAFSYALKLLERVRLASLSMAERLETERIYDELESYFSKTRFSGKDVRKINDAFSRILKLSAKYAV